MRILGIDPGTRVLGFGLIEGDAVAPRLLDAGCVRVSPRLALAQRLRVIHADLRAQLHRLKPEAVAIEKAFYGRDPRALIALGEGRGVALLCAAELEVPIHEYAPAEVKKAVTGNGGARKEQVGAMVRLMLKADLHDHAPDATDALAVALCHLQRAATRHLLEAVPALESPLGELLRLGPRVRRGRRR